MTSSALHSMLPPLTEDEERHSRAAFTAIRQMLAAAGGWLPFDRFMEAALYLPGLGYYSAGAAKLGAGGDFVTAPEISDLFSQCVAHQCADVLAETGGQILELGAGTGRMAAVVLQTLGELGQLPERYAILEVSADLAARQRERLDQLPAALRERVVWLERLPEQPFDGVVVANEVLDALPVRRFVVRGGRARELGVGLEAAVGPEARVGFEAAVGSEAAVGPEAAVGLEGRVGSDGGAGLDGGERLVWRESARHEEADQAFTDLLGELPTPLPDGYRSEICPRVAPWIAGVSEQLRRGLLLLFDYGLPRAHYYHPQRADGTLRCYFKHRAHDDPFVNLAVQDITAWVDFTRVAEAALAAGLEVAGFATQAGFLLGTGIQELAAQATDATDQARLAGEARRLLMPGEMGEAFKVMALCRNLEQPLRGFRYQDLRRSL